VGDGAVHLQHVPVTGAYQTRRRRRRTRSATRWTGAAGPGIRGRQRRGGVLPGLGKRGI